MSRLPEKESGLVYTLYSYFTLNGFQVLLVGQYRADMAGSSVATPDIFLRRMRPTAWPVACYLALETKVEKVTIGNYRRPAGRLRSAQKLLYETGGSVVARTIQAAKMAVYEMDAKLGLPLLALPDIDG